MEDYNKYKETWKSSRQEKFNKVTAAQVDEMTKQGCTRPHYYYHTLWTTFKSVQIYLDLGWSSQGGWDESVTQDFGQKTWRQETTRKT
jgi:hypothetical protein